MTISYKWLLQYLPFQLPIDELTQVLTSIGLEVEGAEVIEPIKGSLKGLVVGEVLNCEPHPNADKLKLTKVNIGADKALDIVCGAPNVAVGQKVIVAPIGSTVFPTSGEPFEIKKAKIRGELSEGMICAEDEIGLGESHNGILVLDSIAAVGMLATTYFNVPEADTAIYIGLTPNRSDAMSHIGVARDVCAYYNYHHNKQYQVVYPNANLPLSNSECPIKINIEPNATKACPRYVGLMLTNVRVGKSPQWLVSYLQTIGVRSINSVVDITNFVLHEYGQPLHAFDASKISGHKINVRFLEKGTQFIGLDGQERELQADDLMICDAEKPLCMAGIFGGNNSGITDLTQDVFLESAYFDAYILRKSSLHHCLRTDAAVHFEKGVDINFVVPAIQRAAQLLIEHCGAKNASQILDIYPTPLTNKMITVKYEFIKRLSGKYYTPSDVRKILEALGFRYEYEDEQQFSVIVPSNKVDVNQSADIIEEIVRIDGLDNIEIPKTLSIPIIKPIINDRTLREKIANTLSGIGFQEIITNSISNSKYYQDCPDMVYMINSLTSELDILRPSMLESGLEVIQFNINRKNKDLKLFEFGKTYSTSTLGKYAEQPLLSMWLSGNASIASWQQKAKLCDLFFAKAVIEKLLAISGIYKVTQHFIDDISVEWQWSKNTIAKTYKITTDKLKRFDIKQDVYYIEILWEQWCKAMLDTDIKYSEISKFPEVQRDLALVLDKSIQYEEIKKVTKQLQISALTSFELFDVFENEKLGTDKKSYALNFKFQLKDKTLTDTEIEVYMAQLIKTYQNKLNAQIRS